MEHKSNLTIPEMLSKLDKMYVRQSQIEKQVQILYKEYEQLSDDIDLAENIIMHQSNKNARQDDKRVFSFN